MKKFITSISILIFLISIISSYAYTLSYTGAQIDASIGNATTTANAVTNSIEATGDSTKIPVIVTGTLDPDWTGTYTYLDQYNSSNRYYNAAKGVYIWRGATPPTYGFWYINQTPGTGGTGWYSGGSVNNYTKPYRIKDGLSWGSYGGYTGTATVLPERQFTINITGALGINDLQGLVFPDQAIFLDSLYIGNGGGVTTHLIGVYDNPLDPISSDGSYNGQYNTFIGVQAGFSNQTGNLNLFVGSSAGRGNTNGTQGTFVGHAAGLSNTTGYHNTYIGAGAGQANTATNYAIAVGTDACLTGCGSYSTIVGTGALPSAAGDTNSIVIGFGAAGQGSNSATIGNGSVTKLCFADGKICWFYGTGAPSAGLCVSGNIGSIYSNVSGGANTTLYVCTDAATWTAK